jgi:hypothetical protein
MPLEARRRLAVIAGVAHTRWSAILNGAGRLALSPSLNPPQPGKVVVRNRLRQLTLDVNHYYNKALWAHSIITHDQLCSITSQREDHQQLCVTHTARRAY